MIILFITARRHQKINSEHEKPAWICFPATRMLGKKNKGQQIIIIITTILAPQQQQQKKL